MRLFLLLTSSLFFIVTTTSQINTFEWQNASYQEQNLPTDSIYFEDFFQEGQDPSQTISEIINSFGQADTQINIYFPHKTYEFFSSLILESNVHLIGDESSFIFDLQGQASDCISIKGYIETDTFLVEDFLNKGDNSFYIDPTHNLSVNDQIYLFDDDNELITSSWALGKTGQVLSISEIDADLIFTQENLRRNYETGTYRYIQRIQPMKNVGVSGIRVVRLDATNAQTSNIYLQYAQNCLISCVESNLCNFAHITVEFSKNIQIQNSYFKDGHDYGSGGKAYGIALQFASSDCLIQNNNFEHLRHSILLQAGPNGNVIAYNYSKDPYWTDVNLPSSSAGEIVLHGNYPYANLFEGNFVKNIVSDNSHGMNGPDNTFFRNKVENGIFFLQSVEAPILANNVIPSNSLYIDFSGTDLIYPNWINNQIQPQDADVYPTESLYLNEAPGFFQNLPYPAIGPEQVDNRLSNAAYVNDLNDQIPPCYSIDTSIDKMEAKHIKIYPNPADTYIHIEATFEIIRVDLLDLNGQRLNSINSEEIDISLLSPGLYLLQITDNRGRCHQNKLVIVE